MILYILSPDTTGVTQQLDQVNQEIHKSYTTAKDDMYSPFASMNKEDFMLTLSEAWKKWVSQEKLVKASKRVGISSSGLNVNWMEKNKFKAASNLIHSTPNTDKDKGSFKISSPLDVRKGSSAYFKYKYEQSLKRIDELENSVPSLEDIPDLLCIQKIKPKESGSKKHKITQVHGSMRASDIIKAAEKVAAEKEAKEMRKKALMEKKQNDKELFYRCKAKCSCEGKCAASELKECSVCHDILKSQCGKRSCRDEAGGKPVMIQIDLGRKKRKTRRRIIFADDSSDDDFE